MRNIALCFYKYNRHYAITYFDGLFVLAKELIIYVLCHVACPAPRLKGCTFDCSWLLQAIKRNFDSHSHDPKHFTNSRLPSLLPVTRLTSFSRLSDFMCFHPYLPAGSDHSLLHSGAVSLNFKECLLCVTSLACSFVLVKVEHKNLCCGSSSFLAMQFSHSIACVCWGGGTQAHVSNSPEIYGD